MKYLFSFLIGFIGILTVTSCGSGNESNSKTESPKPFFSCFLYEDNNGELKNDKGERVCAVKVYSRGEPMNLNFSTEINWNGLELNEVYLKNGKVYTEYPFSSNIDEFIPIATYNMSSQGADIYFEFFQVSNTEELKELAEAKKKEREQMEEAKRLEQEKIEAEKKAKGPSWLQGGRWIHTFIDPTMVELVYYIYEFNDGEYKYVQSTSEYESPRAYKSHPYRVENNIIYNNDTPMFIIDEENKVLKSYSRQNEKYYKEKVVLPY